MSVASSAAAITGVTTRNSLVVGGSFHIEVGGANQCLRALSPNKGGD